MLWRSLWGFARAARLPGGGAAGLPHPRPVAPPPREGEPPPPPPPPSPEAAQSDRSWHGRNQQRKACGYGNLLRCYTPLDAFTWSALACLALELARQVRWLSSGRPRGGDAGIHQLKQQLAILPQHQHSDPPAAPSPCSSKEKEQHFFLGVDCDHAEKNPSSDKIPQPKEYQFLSETGDFVFPPSTGLEPDSCLLHLQGNLEDEDSVNKAASQVQQVFQASVSMASNILGLANMQDGQYTAAFSCFKLAADQNYSKSQFNVGLCYEHGRGTKKNMAKAVLYYRRAARQGHTRAQYCYAKWLLHHSPRTGAGGAVQEAVGPLDQAPIAEQIWAQAHHGMLYQKAVHPEKQSRQKYLHVATRSGGCSSRFRLGVDSEKGFGVPQNPRAVGKHYQQAAVLPANSQPAQESMEATTQEWAAMHHCSQLPLAGRTFSSSPCLQKLDQPLTSHVSLGLLHSWSAESLRDVTSSSVNCMLNPAFQDGLALQLQSFA